MKITHLKVKNFRAIENVSINSDSTMIVVAGPNGCGKSCVLDAIRFIKSAYGGYRPNEWQQWLGEFQIDGRSNPWEMKKILRNKESEATISIGLSLHSQERNYLQKHANSLMEEIAFKEVLPGANYEQWKHRIRIQGQNAQDQSLITRVFLHQTNLINDLTLELENEIHIGKVTIGIDGNAKTQRSLVLESIWSIYDPKYVGLIDYHGPQRHYAREQLGGVNLNLKTQEEEQKQSKLYDYGNKYRNIKTQMATEFVLRHLREAGEANMDSMKESLSDTMRELFRRFFPGKEFHGVRANQNGELEFSVAVSDGKKHDINDLSSGEKEILFGYLRLRNSAERQSIILLDEPELHLNPRLIRGLPQFYQKYICEDLENQIWAVTHSDAFLREAMECSGTRVYHMKEVSSTGTAQNQSQVREILQEEEAAEILYELIGNIAGYRIDEKIVIFESENSEFDLKMTAKLFPEHERKMNFISGGNKHTVRRLHEALQRQSSLGRVHNVFSIVDRDGRKESHDDGRDGKFTWDVYHIENYLLDEEVILNILKKGTLGSTGFNDESEIHEALKEIAKELIDEMVEHTVRETAHRAIRRATKLKGDQSYGEAGDTVSVRVEGMLQSLMEQLSDELSKEKLNQIARVRRKELNSSLKNDGWKKEIPGRTILGKFTSQYFSGIKYYVVRNMIINEMAENDKRPQGMLRILERIDKWSA